MTRPTLPIRKPWQFLRLRRRKPGPFVQTLQPLDAVLLCVDTAHGAGYAIYNAGELDAFGDVRTARTADRRNVVEQVVGIARRLKRPAGLVLEAPYGGAIGTIISLAQSVALWRDSWLDAGAPLAAVLELQAREWRRPLFGTANIPRLEQRRLEQITAGRICVEFRLIEHVPGPDASAAICLGYVCRRSAEMQTRLRCALIEAAPRTLRKPQP
jgi:hypothetical protein